MNIESNLSQVIDITNESAKYDTNIKEILADKQILARILKYTLEEFSGYDIETIIENIDEPEISKVRMEPGHTNTARISKENSEDSIPGEGKIFYDIRFSVFYGKDLIKVLINIEAQKTYKSNKLGYHLDNRILYYLGRMISAQKEVEFINSDYDNLKAVRSIWICMDAGDYDDSINRLRFTQETIFGKDIKFNNLDKVQGIIIRLRENEDAEKSRNTLIAMLEELLKKESVEIKKKRLSDDYDLKLSVETERRLGEMCNLSQVLVEKAEKQGLERGLDKGQELKLIRLVCSKLNKGWEVEKIADLFEEDIEHVKKICEIAKKRSSDCEAEEIYDELYSK